MIFDHFLSFEDVDIALQHTSIDIGDSPISSSSYRHSSDRKTDYNSNNIENSIKNNNVNGNIINNNFIRNINYLNNGENIIDREREREREKERERERRERVGEERVVTELSDNNCSMIVSDGRTDRQLASLEKKRRNIVIDSNKDKQRDRDRNDALPSSSSSSSSYSSSSSLLKRNAEQRYNTRKFLNSTPSPPHSSSSSSSTSSQARTVDCNPFPVLGMTSPILAPHSNFDSPNASIHHLDDFIESGNDVTSSTLFVRRGSAAKDMLRRASLLSPRGVMNTAMKRKHADMSVVSTMLPHNGSMIGNVNVTGMGIGSMREREREEVEETLFGDFAEGTSRFVTRRPRADSIRYLTLPYLNLPPLSFPLHSLPFPLLSYLFLS